MEIPSVSSQLGVASTYGTSSTVQPQEQQAINLRSERERDEATRPDDQVTLSSAARQVAARETERVVPQTEVSSTAEKTQERDRFEHARQAQIEAQREERPAPLSVARALESYTQAAALSI
jgi:hypothetical protein